MCTFEIGSQVSRKQADYIAMTGYRLIIAIIGIILVYYCGDGAFSGTNDLNKLCDKLERVVRDDARKGRIKPDKISMAIDHRLGELMEEMGISEGQLESYRNRTYLEKRVSDIKFRALLEATTFHTRSQINADRN